MVYDGISGHSVLACKLVSADDTQPLAPAPASPGLGVAGLGWPVGCRPILGASSTGIFFNRFEHSLGRGRLRAAMPGGTKNA